jgi:hypothetical protein
MHSFWSIDAVVDATATVCQKTIDASIQVGSKERAGLFVSYGA